MVKFRFVIVDDYDNVKEVLYETQEYSSKNDKLWLEEEFQTILLLAHKFNFCDWENAPAVETQIFQNGEWFYYSNTIEDFMNI